MMTRVRFTSAGEFDRRPKFVKFVMQVASFCLLSAGIRANEVDLVQIATGLANPVFVTHAGDGSDRLFIVEQEGRIRILASGSLLPTPFLDINDRVTSGGERGLLGLAFHPDYPSERRFFVNYTKLENNQLRTLIAEYTTSAGDPNRAQPGEKLVLTFVQPFNNHNGGMLAFGPDAMLYIGTGDGGSAGDPFGNGQNLNTLLGKILRLDVDSQAPYGIPPDNPFLGLPNARGENWAYGLRNPWRFSFDRGTGLLFAGDVGQNTWEEVDIIEGGFNYGWNTMEGPDCFISDPCDGGGLTPPINFYGRQEGRSVTGGYVYRGPQHTPYRGDYIFGDFVSGKVWALRKEGATWQRTELLDTTLQISSFGEDEAGHLYLVDHNGSIYRLDFQETAGVADLRLDGAASADEAIVGLKFVYRFSVSNQGSAPNNDVISLANSLPPGLHFLSAQGGGWECPFDQSSVLCQRMEPIGAQQTSSVEIEVLVGPAAVNSVSNTATISSFSGIDPTANEATVTTPVLTPSELPVTYAQLALGGGFETFLIISNGTDLPWAGNARLGRRNGLAWDTSWSLDGADMSGSTEFSVQLAPHSSRKFVLSGDQEAREGYLQLLAEVGVSGSDVATSVFYNFSTSPQLIDSTGTLPIQPAVDFLFPLEKNANANTAFAWAPFLATSPFGIQLILFDESGSEVGRRLLTYEGHTADFFTDLFQGVPDGFVGSLRVRSEKRIFLTVLRLEFTGEGERFQLTSVLPSSDH